MLNLLPRLSISSCEPNRFSGEVIYVSALRRVCLSLGFRACKEPEKGTPNLENDLCESP